MIIHRMEQRSEEWFKIRLGKFTGTCFPTVANGRTDTKKTLVMKKAGEIITGCPADDKPYTNGSMDQGTEREADARTLFEMETGLPVETVGFVELNEYVGVSPDGLIYDDAGIEIKCPEKHTHLGYLLYGRGNLYQWQIQGGLWVSGRKTWYFASYNPDYPLGSRLYIEKIERDEEKIKQLEAGANQMTAELKAVIKNYKERRIA